MNRVSTCKLIIEIILDGSAGIEELDEPVNVSDIESVLMDRHGVSFHKDKEAWMSWFMNSYPEATEEEKTSLSMAYRIFKAEKRFFDRTKKDKE